MAARADGELLGCRSKPGAMLRSPQVVIYGLGHTRHPALIAGRVHEFADLAGN